jgi:hypothetical protein
MIRSGPSFSCSNRNVWHICCAKLFGLHSMLTSIPTTRTHPSKSTFKTALCCVGPKLVLAKSPCCYVYHAYAR